MGGRSRRVAAAIAVALIAVTAGALASRSGGGRPRTDPEPSGITIAPTPDLRTSPRSVSLTSPMDGTDSRLLPVVAEPSTDLVAGQTVAIAGSGFTPGARLGAVLCSAGAAGGGGVGFCELAHYDNFSADAEGAFADDYVLRRFIVTPNEGQVDCTASTDRCILGVGNISDYDESGGTYISFRGAPDPPPPALRVTPSVGLVDGQVIAVQGTGVRAAPDGWLRQCPADDLRSAACQPLDAQPVGPPVGGKLSVTVAVSRQLGSGTTAVDCAAPPGCVLATTEYAGRMASVPLELLDTGTTTFLPPTTSTPTTSTTTTPTTAPSTSTTEAPPGSGTTTSSASGARSGTG